jgi:hypothetical protein
LLFSDAKFIDILRNPADRAHSLYHHIRRDGYEKKATFEGALAAEEERVRSRAFKRNCPQYYYNFLYFRSGLYGEQIERYLSFFARHQFHFLTLNQLRSDARSALVAARFPSVVLEEYYGADMRRLGSLLGRRLPWRWLNA